MRKRLRRPFDTVQQRDHSGGRDRVVLALGNKEQDGAWGFRPDGSHGNKKTAKHFTAKKIFLEQVIAGTSSFEFVKVHHRARPFPLQDFSLKAPRGSPSVIIAQSLVISTLSDLFIFSIK